MGSRTTNRSDTTVSDLSLSTDRPPFEISPQGGYELHTADICATVPVGSASGVEGKGERGEELCVSEVKLQGVF